MEFATGAMSSLLPKLGNLLEEEYKLQAGVKEDVESLSRELTSMSTALRKVADVPPDDLDDQVKLWARDVKELSCDIEAIVDTFMVRVEGLQPANLGCFGKIIGLLDKFQTRHQIANMIRDIKGKAHEVDELRQKYKVDDHVVAHAKPCADHDPRLAALCVDVTAEQLEELVGIHGARADIIKRLTTDQTHGGDAKQMKIVSIVGFGGSGKTTLAKLVQEYLTRQLELEFKCWAFVSLSRNRGMKTVLKDILRQLDKPKYHDINEEEWHESTLINELKDFLKTKRYFIVIDDIWDITSWQTIKFAMVDNQLGSRIITTTRKFDVAQKVGGVYKLKPLSPVNSKKLFYTRVSGGGSKCPENEHADTIVEKCGGIPLVINTVAGVLASKPINATVREQWYQVYKFIWSGSGHEDHPEVKNMRRVLSFSYYDLPPHLRTCLLHTVSIFPEDHAVIRRDRLVWRWIAEGFVHGKRGANHNLFELGQSYLNELLNTGMMKEEEGVNSKDGGDGMVKYCRVPGVVLDLMLSLSSKEKTCSPAAGKVRRLSIAENSNVDTGTGSDECMKHVRSVTILGHDGVKLMPPLCRFKVLCVMDLEGCDAVKSLDRHIGKLLHLRYLGLRGTRIGKLPMEIGNLVFLQVLDLARTGIEELPSTVVLLRRLMCLYVDCKTRLPAQGVGSLTSLEELSKISCRSAENFVMEELTALRALEIVLRGENGSLEKDLLESLKKLHKVQTLRIIHSREGGSESELDDLMWEGWVPPPDLRRFVAVDGWFSSLPTWIGNSRLALSELHIAVRELRPEDLQTLGRLLGLRSLRLEVERMRPGGGLQVAGADDDAFPSLTELRFRSTETEAYSLIFRQGAMPRVRILQLLLLLNVDHHHSNTSRNSGPSWGLGNLPLLEELRVGISCGDARRREEAEAVFKKEADSHPNHPTLQLGLGHLFQLGIHGQSESI